MRSIAIIDTVKAIYNIAVFCLIDDAVCILSSFIGEYFLLQLNCENSR